MFHIYHQQENVGLKRLNVSFNGFGTEGAACMGQALATNRTLLELDISKNRITNIDVKVLAKQLKSNDTLEVLKVRIIRPVASWTHLVFIFKHV